MIEFIVKFFFTGILFSLATGSFLVSRDKGRTCSPGELYLYSLGLGPVLTVLLLYYMLMLIGGGPVWFYVSLVTITFGLLLFAGRSALPLTIGAAKSFAGHTRDRFRQISGPARVERVLYWTLVFALLAAFLVIFTANTLQLPIDGHDVLVYGNTGKIYYHEKTVAYRDDLLDRDNGFYFAGSPKPSFSLLYTWELMLNDLFRPGPDPKKSSPAPGVENRDIFFRAISAYYGLLIICLTFFWLYRKNRYLALLGILVLLSGMQFFRVLFHLHLDSYRIYFLLLSWIFLAYALSKPGSTHTPPTPGAPVEKEAKKGIFLRRLPSFFQCLPQRLVPGLTAEEYFAFFLLGAFSGLTAFTHIVGIAVAGFNALAFLLFQEKNLKQRIINTLWLLFLILAFGGSHYLLDALIGARFGFTTYFAS